MYMPLAAGRRRRLAWRRRCRHQGCWRWRGGIAAALDCHPSGHGVGNCPFLLTGTLYLCEGRQQTCLVTKVHVDQLSIHNAITMLQQRRNLASGRTGVHRSEQRCSKVMETRDADMLTRRFPTRVQHPTLLSQSLSGPLEAAAPYLHDAPLLPHAQVPFHQGAGPPADAFHFCSQYGIG
jgi:hypothetical protein